jgi:hypothetical protein
LQGRLRHLRTGQGCVLAELVLEADAVVFLKAAGAPAPRSVDGNSGFRFATS